ncbi:N-6 DNA methylase [Helicobacter canis]|uniref:Eco57I restriction-modification methylase domain-containing protein n=1 Tax=Helicobacter canis TaxID=29419 RepID=UPI0026EE42ED|nr:N-6 DNA methylase [Helicobacter canis]
MTLQNFIKSPYNLEYFKDFIQQAFPQAQLLNSPTTPYKDGHIIHAYAPICQDIALESSHILQVFAFEVGSTHAKVTLHKELAKIAKDNASHILACFYDPSDTQEFRLSLITTGFDFEANKSTHSNLRRQSFVLGDSIPTHTAQKQLQTLIDSQAKSKQALEEAFSLEPVTKEFYKEIVGIFITLIDSIQLPLEVDSKKREFAFRLLSRLLFCKFLEKKGVIDQAIFNTTLSDNYYHEVLEPLFFSTLNTPKAKRNYDLLDPRVATLLDSIPYLNGGLFAPQASDFYSPQKPTAYHATLKVPNAPLAELFTLLESYHFSIDESTPDSQEVGLNPELLGLVFESLLSELFTDNRKDSTASLRKSTGSYYTPREIVRYMCRSSLYQYFVSKLNSAFGDRVGFLAKNGDCGGEPAVITALGNSQVCPCKAPFLSQKSCRERTAPESTFEKSHDFKDNAPAPSLRDTAEAVAWQSNSAQAESNQINGARKACNLESVIGGLGAKGVKKEGGIRGDASQVAPLSLLEKTLSQTKLESSNNAKKVDSSAIAEAIHALIFHHDPTTLTQPQKSQILSALQSLKVLDPACGSGAFPIGLMQELLELGEILGDTRSPYTRKLEILQSNIYGIDIQPMATEISRLRCFLSLILEEAPKDIKPLPNLEFKFLSANSLLPLPQDSMLEYDGYQADKQKLESIRQDNFNADLSKRESLKQDYLETAAHIARNLILHAQGESPLTQWNPYDPHSVAEFFDSEYMFGLSGFDIVIGNPPYISSENMPQVIKDNRHIFKTAHKKTDIYVFFYELALKMLNHKGIVSYITSNKFLSQEYGLKLRELFLANTLHKIINFNINVFASANVDTCILIASKQSTPNNHIEVKDIYTRADYDSFTQNICESICQEIFKTTDFYNFRLSLTDEKLAFLESIKAKSHALSDICFVSYGCRPCGNAKNPNLKKKDVIHQTPQGNAKPYIESKDTYLSPYTIHHHDYLDYQPSKFYNAMFEGLFTPTKLMCGRTLGDVRNINFIYDDKGRFCNDSMCCIVLWKDLESTTHPTPKKLITKEKIALSQAYDLLFLQGVLNSKLIKFYVKELLHDGLHFYPDQQKQLPIPKLDSSNQHLYEQISQKVKSIITTHDKEPLQNEIDSLVYKLYNLSNDEIQTIEKEVNM